MRKYNTSGRQKSKYCPHHFTRVFERFKSRGIAPALFHRSQICKATPRAKQLVSHEIKEKPTSSIRQIAIMLDFSNATTREILRKELKVKPFKLHRCQESKFTIVPWTHTTEHSRHFHRRRSLTKGKYWDLSFIYRDTQLNKH